MLLFCSREDRALVWLLELLSSRICDSIGGPLFLHSWIVASEVVWPEVRGGYGSAEFGEAGDGLFVGQIP